nr:uncharacterized protein LOC120960950 [Anopheles coluzzii]
MLQQAQCQQQGYKWFVWQAEAVQLATKPRPVSVLKINRFPIHHAIPGERAQKNICPRQTCSCIGSPGGLIRALRVYRQATIVAGMGSVAVRLWTVLLLLTTAASGQQTPEQSACVSHAGAILTAPLIHCHPLKACDGEAILKPYLALYQQCRINASERANLRDNFLFRLNHWHDDHPFLLETVAKAYEPFKAALESEQDAHRSLRLVPELQRKQLIYSIEAGRLEDAHILHMTLKGQWKPDQIVSAIQDGYHVNPTIMEHLLEFVRAIPVRKERAAYYKAIGPVIRNFKLTLTYVTLLFAGDATGVFDTRKDRDDYISQPLTVFVHMLRWQLANLEFEFHLSLAERFPRYYSLHIEQIFFFAPPHWQKAEKRRLFEIASLFKAKGHRFAAIEQLLKWAHQYAPTRGGKAHLEEILPTLALETEKLRRTVEQTGKSSAELVRLKKLEEKFVSKKDRWNTNTYRTYLHMIKTKGKFGQHRMEMERKG